MKKFKKQFFLFLYGSLLIVVGSFTVLLFNYRAQIRYQKENLLIEKSVIQVDSLITNILQLESDKRGFQLTSDISYLKYIYRIRSGCERNLSNLRSYKPAIRLSVDFSKVESLVKLRLANLDSGLYIFRREGSEQAVTFMQAQTSTDLRENLVAELQVLKTGYLSELETNTEIINDRNNRNVFGLVIILIIFIILMLVVASSVKRVQYRILKNHIKFQEAQRIARIGSWEWDFASGNLKWSHEQFNIIGEDRDSFSLTIQQYLSLLDKQVQELYKAHVKKALDGNAPFFMEHEIVRKDGTKIYVIEQGTVLFDDKGHPFGMFGTTQDITERKKAEEEIQAERKLLRILIDNIPDPIYIKDAEGKKIVSNRADMEFMQVSHVEEFYGKTDLELFPDESGRIGHFSDLIVMQDDKPVLNRLDNFKDKKGNEYWLLASKIPLYDTDNKLIGLLGIGRDISKRVRTEQELAAAQKRFETIFNNSAEGIYQSSPDGKFIIANQAMAGIFGYDTKEELISAVTDIGNQIYADPIERTKLSELLKKQQHVENYEFQVLRKDGEKIWVSGNIRMVRNEQGVFQYFEGTLEDISARKKAEQEILQLNRSLEQFANITAHDLQEPIRMVSGFLGLLDKKYNSIFDDQGKMFIHRAKDGADRMTILIRDLLEFSRSGNKAAKKEPVDLNYVMDLVYKDMGIVLDDTSASLLVPNSLPIVEGSQSALYRLFLNLVSNGLKFRKKNIPPEVILNMKEYPDNWEFTVQDNGIGVKDSDKEKLFQAFQRLHKREDYPGTGLGLVTCKKIVEIHGGRIWMTSEYGKGTEFHFTLPKLRA